MSVCPLHTSQYTRVIYSGPTCFQPPPKLALAVDSRRSRTRHIATRRRRRCCCRRANTADIIARRSWGPADTTRALNGVREQSARTEARIESVRINSRCVVHTSVGEHGLHYHPKYARRALLTLRGSVFILTARFPRKSPTRIIVPISDSARTLFVLLHSYDMHYATHALDLHTI